MYGVIYVVDMCNTCTCTIHVFSFHRYHLICSAIFRKHFTVVHDLKITLMMKMNDLKII